MLLSELFVAMSAPKTSLKPAKRIARKKATAKRKAANAAKKRASTTPKITTPDTSALVKKAKKSLTKE